MAKQEKQPETIDQFLRIPKATVDNFIETVWQQPNPEKKHEMATKMEASEPILNEIVEELTNAYDDPEGVRVGASFACELLANLGEDLPKVTREVADILRQEIVSFGIPEKPISPFVPEPLIGKELINPTLDPYHYAEENPSLMVWVAELQDEFQVGFMIAYELKRRQFHADRLSKRLGNNTT